MRQALYFDTPDDFCDFVRLQGVEARPASGDLFEIHRIVHPRRPGDSALILFNHKSKLKERFFGAANVIKAEIADGVAMSPTISHPVPVVETFFCKTLVESVKLSEWKEPRSAGSGPVFFRVDDPDLVASLISDSLQLGNDRIQFGPIENVEQSKTTIVRIEKPSFYLIQRCLEDHAAKISVYYQEADDLFVRWGWEHPLRDWWTRSERKREGKWIFLDEGDDFIHLDPIIWQDAYDLTDLKLDFFHRQLYSASPETPPRFTVLLRLTQKASDTAEPELWLLDDGGTLQLENTLQLTDDDSLRSWQIAVQTLEGNSRDWIFVRENRAKSKGARHHHFGGTAFARYKGINDLLLPIGYDLQPPLRRDAYRHLFQLEAGFLTVLIPETIVDPSAKEDAFLILKISERAFDSLSTFVDYLVERDAVDLEDLMEKSVFDFKHYLKAPKHPGLISGETPDDGNRKRKLHDLANIKDLQGTKVFYEIEADAGSLMDRLNQEGEIDESALGELEKEELRLERELINHGQSIDLWCDLLVCKNQLGKSADAVICAIEGLWLAADTPREAGLLDTLKTLSLSALNNDPSTVTTHDQEWVRRAAVFGMALQEPQQHEADQWISETNAFLREHDGGLRSKERWLTWGRVLMKNQDVRREAQLREEIRDQITAEGLRLEETPSFLRSRIFLDRKVGSDGDSHTAVETAIGNLEALQAITVNFTTQRLHLAAQAVLARAYSNIGDIGRAQNLLADHIQSNDACALAWEAMFQIEALRGIDQNRANATSEKMEGLLKKADPETKRAITELRELYEARGDAESPAAFLARENRSRTYPRGPGSEVGKLYELSMKLEEHVTAGNEPGAVSVMRRMMTLEDKKEYDHDVKIPQFVETLVAGLERFKWGDRGAGLIPLFEDFSDRIPNYVSANSNPFYRSILHSNLALGLLMVENIEKAVRQIEMADTLVRNGSLSELDFIDSAAALIKTAEQLPLSHRRRILTNLMKELGERFDREHSAYISNEWLFAVLARSLDQLAEAASSKDRLSLHQFRSYQLQDEFLILQRLQSETFTGQSV